MVWEGIETPGSGSHLRPTRARFLPRALASFLPTHEGKIECENTGVASGDGFSRMGREETRGYHRGKWAFEVFFEILGWARKNPLPTRQKPDK
jgi:hypothetical protein